MEFIYASDDANAQAVVVSAHSLLRSTPGAEVTVLALDWSKSSKRFMEGFEDSSRVRRRDVTVEDLPPGAGHISSATFLRLCIPDLLPDLDRCVYLDADTLIRDDLIPLSGIKGGNWSTAGVLSSATPRHGCSPGIVSAGGNQQFLEPYINAGVLLIDIQRWRTQGIGEQALNWFRQNPQAFVDQDALNTVIVGDVLLLPQKYNATIHMMRPSSPVLGFVEFEEVAEARRDSAVVHYTGPVKPWHSNATMPFLAEWRSVAAERGWTKFRHSDTLRRRLERSVIRLIDSQA